MWIKPVRLIPRPDVWMRIWPYSQCSPKRSHMLDPLRVPHEHCNTLISQAHKLKLGHVLRFSELHGEITRSTAGKAGVVRVRIYDVCAER